MKVLSTEVHTVVSITGHTQVTRMLKVAEKGRWSPGQVTGQCVRAGVGPDKYYSPLECSIYLYFRAFNDTVGRVSGSNL